MTAPQREDLDVHVEIDGDTILVGRAAFTPRGARLRTILSYPPSYLAARRAYAIAPDLPLDGSAHAVDGLPGAFADTAPDRWGRNLISRRLRAQAISNGEPPPIVTEIDFLLGVSDATRQGALRFSPPGSQVYLGVAGNVPRVVELAELLRAADVVARTSDEVEADEAVKTLLAAGSGTLGGARPKALVYDEGRLYVAKFPHSLDDEWDVMAWEKTALDLAEQVGIPVPPRRLEWIGDRSVLLLERFDRSPHSDGLRRIGYVSASTLIGGERSAQRDYLDVQAAIEDHSGSPNADLDQLWQRMAFSVAIHNTDDHLRNHGFLRTPRGWRLSPAFDINPNPEIAEPRATSIGGESLRRGEIAALLSIAPYFGLSEATARHRLAAIFEATADWRDVASANGVPSAELSRFQGAFDGVRAEARQS